MKLKNLLSRLSDDDLMDERSDPKMMMGC